ncbi:Formate hydrogenlyase subunit 3/Multisubunit Na+/H+ antiporter, MnhD subunit [Rhizobiales bacterium GAS188]|nr:Formate hydrogenlyase subunit 3/Multisubunit Na+/H+ antiporter, MnhD subunit [Rhizobiales bacterium GAS188]
MPAVIGLGGVAALLAVAFLAVIVARSGSRAVYSACLIVSVAALGVALSRIAQEPAAVTLPIGLPWLGAHFRIDALSAFFLAVVNLGGAAASLYAIGYGQHEPEPGRVLPFFPVFLAGMNLVVMADDAFSFLLSWEFMSLSSWALVMAHHRDPENRRAGFIYLVMASFGTLCLLLAFGLLAGPEGNYAFAAMREAGPSPSVAGLILVLVLIGSGSKAGLVPLHAWLPLAHPAAPSHVSALMSGVMTKVAIYGFLRLVFDLLGQPSWWWSVLVLALGGMTAVLGVLHALMETDLKRVLAYSTVENIGIVFIGLGLALAFRANGMGFAAALALTAALFHALNHMLFKSLLFFGAGSVLAATGFRDIEKLGGLIHRMPATSFAFLVGSAAIAALPPLNGFVSEWLTLQAVLLSPQIPQWGLKLMIPAVGALLALAAALAFACFVRAFGITFLGRARTAAAAEAAEVDGFSLAAMSILAFLCFLCGILPGLVIDGVAPAVKLLVGANMPRQLGVPWLSIVPVAESRSSYNGLLLFLFIAASASVAVFGIHRLASRAIRRSAAWDCGFPDPSPLIQYSASSFAQPIRRVFGTLLFRASEHIDMPPPGDMRPARLQVAVHDLAWEWLYAPIADSIGSIADRLNFLQFLTIRRYLSLVFLALIVLLLVVALWS